MVGLARRTKASTPVVAYPRALELTVGRRTLATGDECKVRGRRGRFTFRCVVTNPHTGSRWVELIGPAGNPRMVSVTVDSVKPIPRRRARG